MSGDGGVQQLLLGWGEVHVIPLLEVPLQLPIERPLLLQCLEAFLVVILVLVFIALHEFGLGQGVGSGALT